MTKTAAGEKIKYCSIRAAHLTTAASCNCQSPTTTMQPPVVCNVKPGTEKELRPRAEKTNKYFSKKKEIKNY